MTAAFCPHCGAELSGEFKFCPGCGGKLPVNEGKPLSGEGEGQPEEHERVSEVLRCPTCGFLNPVGTRACESCGSFLGNAARETFEKGAAPSVEKNAATENGPAQKHSAKKRDKKGPKKNAELKTPPAKRFHLESYQITAIAAALLLGAVVIYGLVSSGTSTPPGGGGNMPPQQTSSSNEPSANVLHEINRLREIVNKEPDDIRSLLQLSNMLQDNGFYDQAAVYYKRYLGKKPKDVDARVDYGVTLFEGGNTQGAIKEIKDALKTDPKHQIGYFNLGIIYLNAGEIDKAGEAFKECVKIDPNSDIGKKAKQALDEHANITSQEVK